MSGTSESRLPETRDPFFLDMGRPRIYLAVQTIQEPPSKDKKKEKGKRTKVDSKEPEEHSLVQR